MTDLVDLNYILGLDVSRLDEKYIVSLESYIHSVAQRVGLRDANVVKTPLEDGFSKADDSSLLLEASTKYRSLA